MENQNQKRITSGLIETLTRKSMQEETVSTSSCPKVPSDYVNAIPSCSELLSQAISNLTAALDACNTCSSCNCTGKATSSFRSTAISFLETEYTGSASLVADICQNCNSASTAVTFSFITDENAVPFVFYSTRAHINTVCCIPSSYLAVSGLGTLVLDGLPIENTRFSLGFGKTSLSQCSFHLALSTEENPPFLVASDFINCEDILISSCPAK